MQKITPFLWFDNNAEEAMNFYAGIFEHAKIGHVAKAGDKVMTVSFELDGQRFLGLNGGPMFAFTEAVSFVVSCATQEEIDDKWERLSEGGVKSRCGWLKDKFGLSWQIVPPVLGRLMGDADGEKANRVMQAMMKMDKIIIQDLIAAADNN